MSPEEKNIIKKEIKQVRAFLQVLRTHNESINEQLALLLTVIGKLRVSYLSIDEIITRFEAKLTKSP